MGENWEMGGGEKLDFFTKFPVFTHRLEPKPPGLGPLDLIQNGCPEQPWGFEPQPDLD